MKKLYTLFFFVTCSTFAWSQIVFESNFETWSDTHTPDGWIGTKTSFQPDSINQSTDGPTHGTYLAELINEDGSHRRFTTQGITLNEGQAYEVEVWVKGSGQVRVGLYDNDQDGFDFGFSYNPYQDVESASVFSFVQVINPDTTYEACEVIISVNNGTVLVDRVEVRIGMGGGPVSRTIAEIQTSLDGPSPFVNTNVSTSGVVTAVSGSGYWIQDGTGPWSGVFVFDNVNVPSLGDVVSIEATIEEYFDLTELTSVDNFIVTGQDVVPAAEELSTLDVNDEQWEGVLVKSTGECTELPNNFGEWLINDGGGTVIIDDVMYLFSPTLGTNYEVVGPVTYAFGDYRILPRDVNDVNAVSSVDEFEYFEISIYPNPTSDVLIIESEEYNGIVLNVRDLTGRMVISQQLNQTRTSLDVSGLSQGNYSLELIGEDSRATSVFSVR